MQTGTATAASRLLHTTQPSISRLLAQLQTACGLRLFDSHKGRLRPTAEARALYATVQQVYVGHERIAQELASLRRSGLGVLRIGATPALAMGVLPHVVREYLAVHPDAHLSLHALGFLPLQDELLSQRIDFAIVTRPQITYDLEGELLHRGRAVCVLSPRHALARFERLHVKQLAGQRLITLSATDQIHMQMQAVLEQHRVESGPLLEASSSPTICAMVMQNIGVGIVNPYIASAFAGTLCVREVEPAINVDVVLHSSPNHISSVGSRRFVDLLRDYFRRQRHIVAGMPGAQAAS